jgi:DNA-binding NarL/FixJ family response regulator
MSGSEVKHRVVIADNNPAIIRVVASLLKNSYEIVATASDGKEALRMSKEHNPSVVILDIAMPVMNGLEAARHMRKRNFGCGIVFLTMYRDPEYIYVARELNASYVFKSRMYTDLLTAMNAALAGQIFISPAGGS